MRTAPIAQCPAYSITDDGQVIRTVPGKTTGRVGPLKLVATGRHREYLMVMLSDGGRQFGARVHRLVAMAFIGPCPGDGFIVCHNDGNPRNNHYSNLRWDTHKNNQADRKRHGTYLCGEKIHQAKLKSGDIPVIIADTRPHLHVAKEYGVDESVIRAIRKGTMWVDAARQALAGGGGGK